MAYQNGASSGGNPLEGVVEEETFRLILDGITEALEEVWRSEEERKKITKQLLLKWHPDKNPACDRELATTVTQHIQTELRRLEEGQPRYGSGPGYQAGTSFDPRNPFTTSETFQKRYNEAYAFYSEMLNTRRKKQEQQNQQTHASATSSPFSKSRSDPNFTRGRTPMHANRHQDTSANSKQNPNPGSGTQEPNGTSRQQRTTPGPREPLNQQRYAGNSSDTGFKYQEDIRYVCPLDLDKAKKLLAQASHDIGSAENDYDTSNPAYEWVCFKSHQAAEKALKATHLAQTGYKSISHDIESLTATLPDDELKRLSKRVKTAIGDTKKFYNLADTHIDVLPHDEFTKEVACDVMMCTRDIIQRSKELVETLMIHHEFS